MLSASTLLDGIVLLVKEPVEQPRGNTPVAKHVAVVMAKLGALTRDQAVLHAASGDS